MMIWPKHVLNTNLEHYHQANLLGAVIANKINVSAKFFSALRQHHHALNIKCKGKTA
jgi:hypothetical protein